MSITFKSILFTVLKLCIVFFLHTDPKEWQVYVIYIQTVFEIINQLTEIEKPTYDQPFMHGHPHWSYLFVQKGAISYLNPLVNLMPGYGWAFLTYKWPLLMSDSHVPSSLCSPYMCIEWTCGGLFGRFLLYGATILEFMIQWELHM